MKKILILEDDPNFQAAYQYLLGNYDASVFICSDIGPALDCFIENEVDLIISDYNLPSATSAVFLKLVKLTRENVPMILITANEGIRKDNPEMHHLVDTLMYKPFCSSDFQKNIDNYLCLCA